MASQLPTHTLRRANLPSSTKCTKQIHQIRHASLIPRPHRPYTFTQLVTLSDGSTYLQRTTSPLPIYRSTKDTRNHPLWQPSLSSLRNVEQDDAGRLRAFRERFGRGWDLDSTGEEEGENKAKGAGEGRIVGSGEEEESLMDLISSGGQEFGVREARAGSPASGDGGQDMEERKMVTVKGADGKLVKVLAQSRAEKRK